MMTTNFDIKKNTNMLCSFPVSSWVEDCEAVLHFDIANFFLVIPIDGYESYIEFDIIPNPEHRTV
jgi:hypothetical protein